jgi:23S rRNA pseudouridine2605 synthase
VSERLQKFLARAGVASRRHAEGLITAGRVSVNNQRVTELGTKVEPTDLVTLDGALVTAPETTSWYLLHKPAGVVTTLSDPEGRPTVAGLLGGVEERVFPVGRLDWDAEGALLLTNDGAAAHRLLHPSFEVPRTYLAKVKGSPTDETLGRLLEGVRLEDGPARALRAERFEAAERNTWLLLQVGEGRPHLVKRLCAALGHPVVRLFRPAQAGISVTGLQPGELRPLTSEEVQRVQSVASGEGGPEPAPFLPPRRHGRAGEGDADGALEAGEGVASAEAPGPRRSAGREAPEAGRARGGTPDSAGGGRDRFRGGGRDFPGGGHGGRRGVAGRGARTVARPHETGHGARPGRPPFRGGGEAFGAADGGRSRKAGGAPFPGRHGTFGGSEGTAAGGRERFRGGGRDFAGAGRGGGRGAPGGARPGEGRRGTRPGGGPFRGRERAFGGADSGRHHPSARPPFPGVQRTFGAAGRGDGAGAGGRERFRGGGRDFAGAGRGGGRGAPGGARPGEGRRGTRPGDGPFRGGDRTSGRAGGRAEPGAGGGSARATRPGAASFGPRGRGAGGAPFPGRAGFPAGRAGGRGGGRSGRPPPGRGPRGGGGGGGGRGGPRR